MPGWTAKELKEFRAKAPRFPKQVRYSLVIVLLGLFVFTLFGYGNSFSFPIWMLLTLGALLGVASYQIDKTIYEARLDYAKRKLISLLAEMMYRKSGDEAWLTASAKTIIDLATTIVAKIEAENLTNKDNGS